MKARSHTDEIAEIIELRQQNSDLLNALNELVLSIQLAAASGIDLTGYVGLGTALRLIDEIEGIGQ